jgi:hypothetical protein
MKAKRIVAWTIVVIFVFILGAIAGAYSYFNYLETLNRNYQEQIIYSRNQRDLMMFWGLNYKKYDRVKAMIALNILEDKKFMKEKSNKQLDIPEYLDSLIDNAMKYRDTGIKFTT